MKATIDNMNIGDVIEIVDHERKTTITITKTISGCDILTEAFLTQEELDRAFEDSYDENMRNLEKAFEEESGY